MTLRHGFVPSSWCPEGGLPGDPVQVRRLLRPRVAERRVPGGLDEHPRSPSAFERGHPRTVVDTRTLVGTTRNTRHVARFDGPRVLGMVPLGQKPSQAGPPPPGEILAERGSSGGRAADLRVPAVGNPTAPEDAGASWATGPLPANRHRGYSRACSLAAGTAWQRPSLGVPDRGTQPRSSLIGPVIQPAPNVSARRIVRLQRFLPTVRPIDGSWRPVETCAGVARRRGGPSAGGDGARRALVECPTRRALLCLALPDQNAAGRTT